ncbi:hypothetical protein GETHLI_33720 [Geothrix limicola]|uniref:Uncharacterized protein n=1 Tax=Geothrix limicola TaxID=2927978 RepID=A0ABQ5QLD2_9BACT|nr:hypothetical protein [Geothrix limicola]GLH74870.1 hypothetical protein GETHLI_33720 [Geothrix limicola]
MNLRWMPCLLVCAVMHADALSDLRGALARLNGQEPVKANLVYQFWSQQGDDKQPVVTEGRANSQVEDGPQGLKICWNRSLIQTAAQEARAKALDPEKKTPTRRAIEGVKAIDVAEYLNGSDELLRTLDQAQLIEEKAETWQGRPARLLSLKVTPRLGQRDKKYVKELEATAKIWIGADGLPLASETQVHMKGRALLVISFEQNQKQEYRYVRAGNRLVVVHHVDESSGSGGGEKGQTKTVVDLSLI